MRSISAFKAYRCYRKQLMDSKRGDKSGKLGEARVREAYYNLLCPWDGKPLEGDERRHWEKVIAQRDESRNKE